MLGECDHLKKYSSVPHRISHMASHTRPYQSTKAKKELFTELWDVHRCNGLGSICRWKLVDEGFLDHFVAQFEKVGKRIASSDKEVVEAIASVKKATAAARKQAHETEPSLPGSGMAISKCRMVHNHD